MKIKIKWICLICFLIFLVLTLFVVNQLFFENTEEVNANNNSTRAGICSNCHTMKPMVDTFYNSVHGGNNKHGFSVASCSDCHLPHDSLANHLFQKGVLGTKDTLAEIGFAKKGEFVENYNDMKEFVYDSGCLKCHSNLKDTNSKLSDSAKFAHNYYFKNKKTQNLSCVSCHNDYTNQNFAHPGLLDKLESNDK